MNSHHHGKDIMRVLSILFTALILAACSTAPMKSTVSPPVHSPEAPAPGPQQASLDSVVQFLITAAATDFHAHGPSPALRFRDVRIGHDVSANGEMRYIMCGRFQPAQDEGRDQWTPFATIKTDPYEQWIGAQATAFCQGPSFTWDEVGDVSSTLQSRFDSLR